MADFLGSGQPHKFHNISYATFGCGLAGADRALVKAHPCSDFPPLHAQVRRSPHHLLRMPWPGRWNTGRIAERERRVRTVLVRHAESSACGGIAKPQHRRSNPARAETASASGQHQILAGAVAILERLSVAVFKAADHYDRRCVEKDREVRLVDPIIGRAR